jgi:hypothetical protein
VALIQFLITVDTAGWERHKEAIRAAVQEGNQELIDEEHARFRAAVRSSVKSQLVGHATEGIDPVLINALAGRF